MPPAHWPLKPFALAALPKRRQASQELLPSLPATDKGRSKPAAAIGDVAGRRADGAAPQWLSDAEAWAALRESGLPVLILHGAQDRIVPPGNSRRLLDTMPNAKLIELDDCGHCPQVDAPSLPRTRHTAPETQLRGGARWSRMQQAVAAPSAEHRVHGAAAPLRAPGTTQPPERRARVFAGGDVGAPRRHHRRFRRVRGCRLTGCVRVHEVGWGGRRLWGCVALESYSPTSWPWGRGIAVSTANGLMVNRSRSRVTTWLMADQTLVHVALCRLTALRYQGVVAVQTSEDSRERQPFGPSLSNYQRATERGFRHNQRFSHHSEISLSSHIRVLSIQRFM